MTRVLTFVAVLAAAALMVPLAGAPPPTGIPPGPSHPQINPGQCPTATGGFFDVKFEFLANGESVRIFSDGRILITGRFLEKLTNLSNGKSIVVQANGPIFIENAVTVSGNSVIIIPHEE